MSWRTEQLSEGVILYCGDCREILPTLGGGMAVVSDPPYGIAFAHGGNDKSGIGKGAYATKFAKVAIEGDAGPFDPTPMLAAGDEFILWGGNHFADRLPASACWLIWDKRAASQHSNDFADCEIAWTSGRSVARIFRHQWDGMMKASERGIQRVHPTQKPVALMEWCLRRTTPEKAVLDPYMGSGTTGVACVRLGRRFVGIEINPGFFDVACRRIGDELKQGRLFAGAEEAVVPEPPAALPGLFGEAAE